MLKKNRNIRLLDNPVVEYVRHLIESGDPTRTKQGLQNLCKLYRNGNRIRPDQLVGIEQSVVGLLFTRKRDEKVRRWALNVLARLGREDTCIEAVVQCLREYGHEPQTAASAIAAIFRISRNAMAILKSLSFDEPMITLAALQHVAPDKLDLSVLPLDVETASTDLLRLALVVVGLDRAPDNMLNPRHANSTMVKALGAHEDSIVSQYSIWAITESELLGIDDLGIDIRNVESQPSNVRAWIFQLIAMSRENAALHLEYLELGMRDLDPEARNGLAMGLRDTFFDGLEALVLDWFVSEADREVSLSLLDHIVMQARNCPGYETLALEMYESGGSRQRMEAHAIGTPLYAKFRRISYDGASDLFRRDISVTNNTTFNVNGGIQGGSVSLGGNAANFGPTSVRYDAQTNKAIMAELTKAERELRDTSADESLKHEVLKQVQSAKDDPAPDKIANVISALGRVDSIATHVSGAGTAIGGIITTLGKLTGAI
jgi:hypothetical protein